ncbi:MAG: YitT family protein [Bacteroidaceae bacterium]|nr:YitT family protein [Bacteroidaceae bacterium]MDE6633762.1 YitT family protein [Bacteroidaceae bacterium]MDE7166164.1 YitT family protein [Bacteroidaceae bacterium]
MVKELLLSYVKIILGLTLFCIGYTCFMLPYQIMSGGVSGISAFIYYVTGFHAGYSYFIINIVLILMAWYTLGWRFCVRTIIATVVASFLIDYMQAALTEVGPDGEEHMKRLMGNQIFMAGVMGGMLEGVGLSIVFLAGGSTGGTDIVALTVNKYRDISLGRVMLFVDIFIVGLSFIKFRNFELLVTSYIIVFISTNVIDYIVNRAHQSVQFIIISEKDAEIAQAVSEQLERGVTILHGEGWYSKEPRRLLLIMARKQESRRLFQLIRIIDPHAFMTMSNVEGVFGEGFDKIKKG